MATHTFPDVINNIFFPSGDHFSTLSQGGSLRCRYQVLPILTTSGSASAKYPSVINAIQFLSGDHSGQFVPSGNTSSNLLWGSFTFLPFTSQCSHPFVHRSLRHRLISPSTVTTQFSKRSFGRSISTTANTASLLGDHQKSCIANTFLIRRCFSVPSENMMYNDFASSIPDMYAIRFLSIEIFGIREIPLSVSLL